MIRITTLALAASLLATTALAEKNRTGEPLPTTATGVQTSQNASEGHHHRHGKFDQALTQLPKEKAEIVRQAMNQAREQNKPLYDQLRKLHDQRVDLLKAESFDKHAFAANQEATRKLHDQMMTNMDDAVATYEEKLSPQERLSLANVMHPGHDGPKEEQH